MDGSEEREEEAFLIHACLGAKPLPFTGPHSSLGIQFTQFVLAEGLPALFAD